MPSILRSGALATVDQTVGKDTTQHSIRSTPAKQLGLTTLPPEIHLLIIENLIYPDRLALKHTDRYFYCIVDTGVKIKVSWLMSRRMLHLKCPNNVRCEMGSDLRFCRGSVA